MMQKLDDIVKKIMILQFNHMLYNFVIHFTV